MEKGFIQNQILVAIKKVSLSSQPACICSKSTMETAEQSVKSLQS